LPISRAIATGILVLVILISLIVGLASLANPSVQVPVFGTRTYSETSYHAYQVTLFTASFAPYATSTTIMVSYFYQPGNFPGCDPASMACRYGIPDLYYYYSTSTYLRLSTSFYTVTSFSPSTFTGRVTSTDHQNIPMYASLNLSQLQFVIFVGLVSLFAIVLAIFMAKRIELSRSENVKPN
jgi:hypothetical protein